MTYFLRLVYEFIRRYFGYIAKGDLSANDFTIGDFSVGTGWNVLDFTGIVPSGTRLIHITLNVTCASTYRQIRFRQTGFNNVYNIQGLRTASGARQVRGTFFIQCSPDLLVDYNVQSGTWTEIALAVIGYYRSESFDNLH